MKKMTVAVLIAGCMVWAGASSVWADGLGKVQARQYQRIHQGVHNGALTGAETHLLLKEQRRLRHANHAAWADGVLTRHERERLQAKQCRTSRHIYRLKHNTKGRW